MTRGPGLGSCSCDVGALDDYLPAHVARMARKVVEALEETRPATT
ncbi:hypothetical protein ACWFQ8_18370 [Streptomyces sp. NPDC055254]